MPFDANPALRDEHVTEEEEISISAKKILRDALRLIEEKGWCQRHLAKDARGRVVAVHNGTATQFCSIGAIARASNDRRDKGSDRAERTLMWVVGREITAWNDEKCRQKPEVVAAFQCAIELA